MRRIGIVLLSIGMLINLIFPLRASAANAKVSDQKNIEEFIQIMSKDMLTGEVVISSFSYQLTQNKQRQIQNIRPAWYPESIAPCDNNSVQPMSLSGIIGTDDREKVTNTKRFPYSAVCYLEATWSGNSYSGTAWMINDNIAITAGHCVYDESLGGMADSVTVWPGKNGDGIFGREPYGNAIKTIIQAPDWINSGEAAAYDWALIVLDRPIGEETGWFGFGYREDDFMNVEVFITGYPGEYNCKQYQSRGYISAYNDHILFHDIDSTRGQSGSPVYTNDYIAYGIDTESENSSVNNSVRITRGMFYFFEGYINNY